MRRKGAEVKRRRGELGASFLLHVSCFMHLASFFDL
jgi:hypothetical protein